MQVIQMQLSKKPKICYQFLIAFLESISTFWKKWIKLTAQLYPILLTPKDLAT